MTDKPQLSWSEVRVQQVLQEHTEFRSGVDVACGCGWIGVNGRHRDWVDHVMAVLGGVGDSQRIRAALSTVEDAT
jgi:hypothetical protein